MWMDAHTALAVWLGVMYIMCYVDGCAHSTGCLAWCDVRNVLCGCDTALAVWLGVMYVMCYVDGCTHSTDCLAWCDVRNVLCGWMHTQHWLSGLV